METPTFIKLGRAFIDGMSFFIPFSSYESRLFLARRLAGVPGYQFDVDMTKEKLQRQVFTVEELKRFKEQFQNSPAHEYRQNMVFDEKIRLLEIQRIDDLKHESDESENSFGHYTNLDDNNNDDQSKWQKGTNSLINMMELKQPSELLVTEVKEDNISAYLNDRRFHELSFKDQILVKAGMHHARMIENRFTKPLYEAMLSFYLFMMEKYHNSQK